jgi:hypothetical protein
VTHLELSFTGKVLLFKKLAIQSNDTFSDFHSVSPNLTFAQGVELLKKEAAENSSGSRAVQAERQTGERAQNQRTQAKDQSLCCNP